MTPTNPRPPETPDPVRIVTTLTGKKTVRVEIDGELVVDMTMDSGKKGPSVITGILRGKLNAIPEGAPIEIEWINKTGRPSIDDCHRSQAIVKDTIIAFERFRSGALGTPMVSPGGTVGSTGRKLSHALRSSSRVGQPGTNPLTKGTAELDGGTPPAPSLAGSSPSAPVPGPTEEPEQPSGPAVASPAAEASRGSAIDKGRRGTRRSDFLAKWLPTLKERQDAADASALQPATQVDRFVDSIARKLRGLPSLEEEASLERAARDAATMSARVRPTAARPGPVASAPEVPLDPGATNYGLPDDFKAAAEALEEAETAQVGGEGPTETVEVAWDENEDAEAEATPAALDPAEDFDDGPTDTGVDPSKGEAPDDEDEPEPAPDEDDDVAKRVEGFLGAPPEGDLEQRREAAAARLAADLGVDSEGEGEAPDPVFQKDGSVKLPPPSGRFDDVVGRKRAQGRRQAEDDARASRARRRALKIGGFAAAVSLGVVVLSSLPSLYKSMFPDSPQTATSGATDTSNSSSSSASTPTTPDAPASTSGAAEAAPTTHTVEMNLKRVWSGGGRGDGKLLSGGGKASATVSAEAGLWETGATLAEALDVTALDGKKGLLTHQTNKRMVTTVGGQMDIDCSKPASILIDKMDYWGDGEKNQNWDDSGWGPVVENIQAAGLEGAGICDVAQHVNNNFPNSNAGTWMLGEAALLDGYQYLSYRYELGEKRADDKMSTPKQQHDEAMATARAQIGPTMAKVAEGIIRGEITRPVLPEKKTDQASLQRVNPGEYAERSAVLASSSKAVTFVPKAKARVAVAPTDAPDAPIALRMKRPASQPFDHIDISKVTAEPKAKSISVARRSQVKAQAPSRTAQEAFGGFIPTEKVAAQAPAEKTVIARRTTPTPKPKKRGGFFSGIAKNVKKAAAWASWRLG